MPSLEGEEIEVALAAGFREERLHVVDRNPAIVATLRRRYPRIHTYGVELPAAAARMTKSGVELRYANLDLCGQLSASGFREIREFVQAISLSPLEGLVAVTALRGRESPAVTADLVVAEAVASQFVAFAPEDRRDRARLDAIATHGLDHCRTGVFLQTAGIKWGRYRSSAGTLTFLWGIFPYITPDRFDRTFVRGLATCAALPDFKERLQDYWSEQQNRVRRPIVGGDGGAK